ncbi:expressed unknown protein [Seminavis robusta]|uniref:Uncharacterized protein n=1 Tax=Seminavis robusta TaxID=568900 RepID=A0A9N8ESF4_9STRA|nr:expressed unknown protein [Seminavis robusta]|eukprot:Sro1971_g308581.1  (167) ;mRNA; r:7959-8459
MLLEDEKCRSIRRKLWKEPLLKRDFPTLADRWTLRRVLPLIAIANLHTGASSFLLGVHLAVFSSAEVSLIGFIVVLTIHLGMNLGQYEPRFQTYRDIWKRLPTAYKDRYYDFIADAFDADADLTTRLLVTSHLHGPSGRAWDALIFLLILTLKRYFSGIAQRGNQS